MGLWKSRSAEEIRAAWQADLARIAAEEAERARQEFASKPLARQAALLAVAKESK